MHIGRFGDWRDAPIVGGSSFEARIEWIERGKKEPTGGCLVHCSGTTRSENAGERAFRQGETYSLVYPSEWPMRSRRGACEALYRCVEGATLSISWRTDYAIRLVYELAKLGPGARASIGIVAENAGVPYDFARQIANRLARCGLLRSRRGSHGGFALARSPEELTLLDVFEAMGEQPTMSLCTHNPGACSRTSHCPVHSGVWRPLDDVIHRQLASMTMADAVEAGRSV